MTKLEKAISFMEAGHRGQTRKDGIRPYSIHPMDVMERVRTVTDDEDILIAALLHDIAEDVNQYPYDLDGIAERFGVRVSEIVNELTDVYIKKDFPELNRKRRKQLERERYQLMSPEAKLVKIADICSNLKDTGDVPDAGFNRMFGREKELCLPYLELKEDARNSMLMHKAQIILEEHKHLFKY